MDLFQFEPFRQLGHLADACGGSGCRRCQSRTRDWRSDGRLVSASVAGREMAGVFVVSEEHAWARCQNECRAADDSIASGWSARSGTRKTEIDPSPYVVLWRT